MKTFKLALAITALSFSTNASAMPEPVPDRWSSNMAFRLNVMGSNPGFCRHFYFVWVCQS